MKRAFWLTLGAVMCVAVLATADIPPPSGGGTAKNVACSPAGCVGAADIAAVTASRVLVSDGSGLYSASSTIDTTELGLLNGLSGTVWCSANDGASSGLDADLLDGTSSAAFALLAGPTFTGTTTIATGIFTGTLDLQSTVSSSTGAVTIADVNCVNITNASQSIAVFTHASTINTVTLTGLAGGWWIRGTTGPAYISSGAFVSVGLDGAASTSTEVFRVADSVSTANTSLAAIYGEGMFAIKNVQTITCADVVGAGLGTATLDPTSSNIEIVNADSDGCTITADDANGTSLLGGMANIALVSNAGGSVTIADVADKFLVVGASKVLTEVPDSFRVFRTTGLANDVWYEPGDH